MMIGVQDNSGARWILLTLFSSPHALFCHDPWQTRDTSVQVSKTSDCTKQEDEGLGYTVSMGMELDGRYLTSISTMRQAFLGNNLAAAAAS